MKNIFYLAIVVSFVYIVSEWNTLIATRNNDLKEVTADNQQVIADISNTKKEIELYKDLIVPDETEKKIRLDNRVSACKTVFDRRDKFFEKIRKSKFISSSECQSVIEDIYNDYPELTIVPLPMSRTIAAEGFKEAVDAAKDLTKFKEKSWQRIDSKVTRAEGHNDKFQKELDGLTTQLDELKELSKERNRIIADIGELQDKLDTCNTKKYRTSQSILGEARGNVALEEKCFPEKEE